MENFDAQSIRLSMFVGILVAMYITEIFFLNWRRKAPVGTRRWHNFFLVIFNSILGKFTIGAAPMLLAYYAVENQWGLLNLVGQGWHTSVLVVLSIILLDLAIYTQHLVFHKVDVLWALHAAHHSDPDLDFSSGFRFHPFEIIVSFAIKAGVVLALGLHPLGVLIFEVLLNASSTFHHSNIRLPKALSHVLSKVIITQELHRVHHSRVREESDSNFGFTTPVWDMLFKTYLYKSRDELKEHTIGLPGRQSPDELSMKELAWLPFKVWGSLKTKS